MESVGIQCRNCKRKWRIILPPSDQPIIVFAAICDCGEVFAGNKQNSIHGSILSNGSFDLVEIDSNTPSLQSE